MTLFQSDYLWPAFTFFLFFGLAFSFIELILVFLLNHLAEAHWKWMIDVIIKAKVKYGKIIRLLAVLMAVILSAVIFWIYPFDDFYAQPELRLLMIGLPLLMGLIFFFNIYRTTKLKIEKQIYGFLFLMFSLIIYGSVLAVAQEGYPLFSQKVNQEWIQPGSEQIQMSLQAREKKKLLAQFRKKYQAGECQQVNYENEEQKGRIIHFIFVSSEREFIQKTEHSAETIDPQKALRGTECNDGENRFLLTPEGNWYWVSE